MFAGTQSHLTWYLELMRLIVRLFLNDQLFEYIYIFI